jgi:hypothetical protein
MEHCSTRQRKWDSPRAFPVAFLRRELAQADDPIRIGVLSERSEPKDLSSADHYRQRRRLP